MKIKLVLFLLFLVSPLFAEDCYKNTNANAKRMIGHGIDATQFQPLSPQASNRQYVIEITCKKNKTYQNPYNPRVTYFLPDQVAYAGPKELGPEGKHAIDVDFHENMASVKSGIWDTIMGPHKKGTFTNNAMYKKFAKLVNERQSYPIEAEAVLFPIEVFLLPYWELALSSAARNYIEKMLPPKFEENPAAYIEFIKNFGTHFIHKVVLSGVLRAMLYIPAKLLHKFSRDEIIFNSKALLSNALFSIGCDGYDKMPLDPIFADGVNKSYRYYGGETDITKEQFSRRKRQAPTTTITTPTTTTTLTTTSTTTAATSTTVSSTTPTTTVSTTASTTSTTTTIASTAASTTTSTTTPSTTTTATPSTTTTTTTPSTTPSTTTTTPSTTSSTTPTTTTQASTTSTTISSTATSTAATTAKSESSTTTSTKATTSTASSIIASTKPTTLTSTSTTVTTPSSTSTRRPTPPMNRPNGKIVPNPGNTGDQMNCNGWKKQVSANPWIFAASLIPITELFPKGDKRTSMERAVQIHMWKAYLRDLLKSLTTIAESIKSQIGDKFTDQRINVYKERLEVLLGKYPTKEEVDSLTNEVEKFIYIPNWFLMSTEFCFYWTPDNNGEQCVASRRNLCAHVNDMTSSFYMKTMDEKGTCMMKWGITSPYAEDWFKLVQLCFRWSSSAPNSRCGRGTATESCAPVNTLTQQFIDAMDTKKQGCAKSWKLVIPFHAPLWTFRLTLCIDITQKGKNSDCKMEGDKKSVCVPVNEWTPKFTDNTEGEIGCAISWGLNI